ncbi:MAG: hypothetical protein AAF958_11805 [Planctomycetota bacterium]
MLLALVFVVAVATYANSQEDSPLIWGVLTFVMCVVFSGIGAATGIGGFLGNLLGGALSFGLLQLKIAKFG